MAQRPLCFVLMPFGRKSDPGGRGDIDFDRIYSEAIAPAIEDADLEPIRADEERTGGIIHKAMFERLLLCEYAVADLTTANANVFYELGVRHAARPRTTQAIFGLAQPIPFDVTFLRALPYDLGADNGFGAAEAQALRTALAARLVDLRDQAVNEDPVDSPLFELLGDWRQELPHAKTDVFREQVRLDRQRRDAMKGARGMAKAAGVGVLEGIQAELLPLDAQEAGVVVDLLLSYRALEGWEAMIALCEEMPAPLRRQVLVREQLGFALNRRGSPGDRAKALELLEEVETEQGPNPETCGLIGRIHKDLWDAARVTSPAEAPGHLKRAIELYRRGFEADWRDHYPGINAVTLLDIAGDPASLEAQSLMLPVVRYAALRNMDRHKPDYWDHATLLELAILESDQQAALSYLSDALASAREQWEPRTTARNLGLITEARQSRGTDVTWITPITDALLAKATRLEQGAP